MVDPRNVTNYKRTNSGLEEFVLFSIAVAGKTAKQIAFALEKFLDIGEKNHSPFEKIKLMEKQNKLLSLIKESKLGKHGLLVKAFSQISNSGMDLRKCSTDDLEKIYGIGPKTSRFFILHSRPKQKIAVLDTHILKYIAKFVNNVPSSTPSKNKYRSLESWFIKHCEDLKVDISQKDLEIWNSYARQ